MARSDGKREPKIEAKPSRQSPCRPPIEPVKEELEAGTAGQLNLRPSAALTPSQSARCTVRLEQFAVNHRRGLASEDTQPNNMNGRAGPLDVEASEPTGKHDMQVAMPAVESSAASDATTAPRRSERDDDRSIRVSRSKRRETNELSEGRIDINSAGPASARADRISAIQSSPVGPKERKAKPRPEYRKPASDAPWRGGSLAKVWNTRKMTLDEELAQWVLVYGDE